MDLTILGAMQVSQYGDLANWMIPVRITAVVVLPYSEVPQRGRHKYTDESPKHIEREAGRGGQM